MAPTSASWKLARPDWWSLMPSGVEVRRLVLDLPPADRPIIRYLTERFNEVDLRARP
jgi:hypothetical protein